MENGGLSRNREIEGNEIEKKSKRKYTFWRIFDDERNSKMNILVQW